MRTRALVVTPRMPWPLDDGGRIGLWQQLWSVTREYDTTLVTLESPEALDRELPQPIRDLGIEVVRVPHRPPPVPLALLRGLVGRWPYTLARYRSRRLEVQLRRLVTDRRPAFALVNHLHLATHIDALEGTAVVLREHNLEHRWLERYAESLRSPAARTYARLQARRMRPVEGVLCDRADLVLAIHESEAEALRVIAPRAWIEVVPVGLDFARYQARRPQRPPVVLLVASFGWPPNADGARAFLAEGWPRVRARLPEARLRLVGKDLPADVSAQARAAGAEPVGYVEEMASEFAGATAMAVPLWVGAGARVKIVESLAARLPVASTAIGAEGLGLVAGEHFLCADAPAALGEAVADLLESPDRAARMAEVAHAHARERFSIDAVARRACLLCAEAAERHARCARSRE